MASLGDGTGMVSDHTTLQVIRTDGSDMGGSDIQTYVSGSVGSDGIQMCNSGSSAPSTESVESPDFRSLLKNGVSELLHSHRETSVHVAFNAMNLLDDAGVSVVRRSGSGSTRYSMASAPQGMIMLTDAEKETTRAYLHEIFQDNIAEIKLEKQHLALGRVVRSIFEPNQGAIQSTTSTTSSTIVEEADESQGSGYWAQLFEEIRRHARNLVEAHSFIGFFMVLTVYAIFGMDLVGAFGNSSHDHIFLILNTVAFMCFLCEIVLHALGKRGYVFAIPFVLDFIALVSLVFDTWFMQKALVDEAGVDVARMARSSRMARLARLARIGRFTKMFQGVLSCRRPRQGRLARLLLTKRLWRVFLFLDFGGKGYLSAFDLKFFYLIMLQLQPIKTFPVLLQRDAPILGCQPDSQFSWEQFVGIFYTTCLGKLLLKNFIDEIDLSGGGWKIVGKVSTRSSLKITCIVLALLAAMAVFETDPTDDSAQQGLIQLDLIARQEHANPADLSFLCQQMHFFRQHHEALLLYLDGRIRWVDGHCATRDISQASLFDSINGLIADAEMRESDHLKVCVAGGQVSPCPNASSVGLIDNSAKIHHSNVTALLTSVLTVVLLLLFIYLMDLKFGTFSRALLNPLRELLDDMVIMSDPRLAHLDKEMPGYVEYNPVQELAELHSNFRSLRSSVMLWSKYTPISVTQRLYNAGMEAQIGVSPVTATILFCDLEGFDDACKDLEPEGVLLVLSRVLSAVAEVIDSRCGTLLEFIGDEVLAVFNCPNYVRHHELAGVSAALDIHKAVDKLQWIDVQDGKEKPVRCRCGVHKGKILAGNIGSRKRMKYGLLGDGVNLTARLKGLNARYRTQTLLSQEILADHYCKERILSRPVDIVAVKGKTVPTVVYEAIPMSTVKLIQTTQKHCEAFALYQERKFEEARAVFAEVAGAHCGEDVPALMLMNRCSKYISEPPPADWDGVERLTAKSF